MSPQRSTLNREEGKPHAGGTACHRASLAVSSRKTHRALPGSTFLSCVQTLQPTDEERAGAVATLLETQGQNSQRSGHRLLSRTHITYTKGNFTRGNVISYAENNRFPLMLNLLNPSVGETEKGGDGNETGFTEAAEHTARVGCSGLLGGVQAAREWSVTCHTPPE